MKIEQIYTGCLSQGAYYIQSGKEAVVIDPLREIEPYVQKAIQDDVRIKYVLETHFHADFVSGHLDLAAKTGATIVYGPLARPKFPAHIASDGEELQVGDCTVKVLHTPGHTMESTSYLLSDETGKNIALFSGDTLLLGDVGRPDLATKAANLTKEELAGLLYDSLRIKIMPLADDVIVYPGHGAGSACGKKMMKETFDTLGNQKKINYALHDSLSRIDFISEVTDGLLTPPAYFPENVRMNKEGYDSIDSVLRRGKRALSMEEFKLNATTKGVLVLDTRDGKTFGNGFIPGSIHIGLNGSFAHWAGCLIPGVRTPILLIADEGREEEAATRLARVGYDHLLGYLQGGYEAWIDGENEFDFITSISAGEFVSRYLKQKLAVVDVRTHGEYQAEHIATAQHIPLDSLNTHLDEIVKEGTVYIYCAGGYRSMIAASILMARGWMDVINVTGGFQAIKENEETGIAYLQKPKRLLAHTLA
ncbi:MAG TPA: MBL fold metallo-hydrolase [Cyclobacteriaceae bacterium]